MKNTIYFRTVQNRKAALLQSVVIQLKPGNASHFNITIPKGVKPYVISNLADIEFDHAVITALRYKKGIDDEALKAELRLGIINNTAYLGEQAAYSNDISILCNYDKNPYDCASLSISYSKIDVTAPSGVLACINSLPAIFQSISAISATLVKTVKPGDDYGAAILSIPLSTGDAGSRRSVGLGYYLNRLDNAYLFYDMTVNSSMESCDSIMVYQNRYSLFLEKYERAVTALCIDYGAAPEEADMAVCRLFILYLSLNKEFSADELEYYISLFLKKTIK